jgi:uncharacterized protein (TIGR03067 family)
VYRRVVLIVAVLAMSSCSPRPDPEQLRGEWAVVELYKGETTPSKDPESRANVTITENALVMKFAGDTDTSDIKVDARTRPPSIDLSPRGEKGAWRGIWKLDGDTLTICVARGGSRPKDFAPGADRSVLVLRRANK